MTVFLSVAAIILGVIVYDVVKNGFKRWRYQYHWSCQHCYLNVHSTDQTFIDYVKVDHMKSAHPEVTDG